MHRNRHLEKLCPLLISHTYWPLDFDLKNPNINKHSATFTRVHKNLCNTYPSQHKQNI